MSAPKPRRFVLKEVLEMPLSTRGNGLYLTSKDKLLLETEVSAYYGEAMKRKDDLLRQARAALDVECRFCGLTDHKDAFAVIAAIDKEIEEK